MWPLQWPSSQAWSTARVRCESRPCTDPGARGPEGDGRALLPTLTQHVHDVPRLQAQVRGSLGGVAVLGHHLVEDRPAARCLRWRGHCRDAGTRGSGAAPSSSLPTRPSLAQPSPASPGTAAAALQGPRPPPARPPAGPPLGGGPSARCHWALGNCKETHQNGSHGRPLQREGWGRPLASDITASDGPASSSWALAPPWSLPGPSLVPGGEMPS